MSTAHSIIELRKMSPSELRRDLKLQHAECARMRIAIDMQSEKNHAQYRRMKRDIARMTMVLREMEKQPHKDVSPEKTSQAKKKSVQGPRSKSGK